MLIITRALPGAGKTTRAKDWVAEDPKHRARVNRDDIRSMLHGDAPYSHETEVSVRAVRDRAIRSLLSRNVDVICDDTNLVQRTARDLRELAQLEGTEFEIWDMTNVPLDVCLARNAARLDKTPVPEDKIVEMWEKYIRPHGYPLPPLPSEKDIHDTLTSTPYESLPDAVPVILVDIDGTVALKGTRSPYDESKVHEDRPNRPVIAAVRSMYRAGYRVIFMSGRTEACRYATEAWLKEHVDVHWLGLHMRSIGDMRKDAQVKQELFDAHVRHEYNVIGVFDDRQQVVDHWRALGLTVFQVAPGDF